MKSYYQDMYSVQEFDQRILAQARNLTASLERLEDIFETRLAVSKTASLEEPARLTKKQTAVLGVLANCDLSITEVADKLCISPITAHQHIAAARKALNKKTNIGAIKEAIRQGLISYDFE